MNVLIVEPGTTPRRADIPHTLSDMQSVVGGYIELLYHFKDPVTLVCNEYGKLEGLKLNRVVYSEDRKILDIVAGTFFLAGLDKDFQITDLPANLMKKYERMFFFPNRFVPGAEKMLLDLLG